MVSATRDPTDALPLNSHTAAMSMACFMVREQEETDVPKELATSLAPKMSARYGVFVREHTDVPGIETSEYDG